MNRIGRSLTIANVTETTLTIPPPPRALHARAKSQSWNEPAVRSALIGTLIAAFIFIAVTFRVVSNEFESRKFMKEGIQLQGRVTQLAGKDHADQLKRDSILAARLVFKLPGDEREREVEGTLSAKPAVLARKGEVIDIVVSKDGKRWIEKIEPAKWSSVLMGPALLVPVLLLAMVILVFNRARVLRRYRIGEHRLGRINDVLRTAISPGSRLLRVSLLEGDDRRIFSVIWPNRLGAPDPEHAIDLIVDPRNPTKALAAAAYRD